MCWRSLPCIDSRGKGRGGKGKGGEERGGRAGVGNGEGEKEAMKEEKNLYHFLSIPVHL